MNDEVEINGYIEHDTPDAILLHTFAGAKEVNEWIPRSKIEDYQGKLIKGEEVTIWIPEWLADAKGLL